MVARIDDIPKQDRTDEHRATEKKVYQSPSLVEWGNIRDLTGGSYSGLADHPYGSGGSGPLF